MRLCGPNSCSPRKRGLIERPRSISHREQGAHGQPRKVIAGQETFGRQVPVRVEVGLLVPCRLVAKERKLASSLTLSLFSLLALRARSPGRIHQLPSVVAHPRCGPVELTPPTEAIPELAGSRADGRPDPVRTEPSRRLNVRSPLGRSARRPRSSAPPIARRPRASPQSPAGRASRVVRDRGRPTLRT